MLSIEEFVEELSKISQRCRVKIIGGYHPTRRDIYRMKGEIDGKYYSIIVYDSKVDVPILIVRDHTECKRQIMEIWDGFDWEDVAIERGFEKIGDGNYSNKSFSVWRDGEELVVEYIRLRSSIKIKEDEFIDDDKFKEICKNLIKKNV